MNTINELRAHDSESFKLDHHFLFNGLQLQCNESCLIQFKEIVLINLFESFINIQEREYSL